MNKIIDIYNRSKLSQYDYYALDSIFTVILLIFLIDYDLLFGLIMASLVGLGVGALIFFQPCPVEKIRIASETMVFLFLLFLVVLILFSWISFIQGINFCKQEQALKELRELKRKARK